MGWIKKASSVLIVFFALPIAASDAKNIKVGTVLFDPPYVISLNQGFEIDLIKLLCQRIHAHCDLITMKYQALFKALDNGRIDIAVDGIDFYITPNPLNGHYIYSYPYLLSKGQFLVLQSSGIKSIDALPKGSNVGLVQENTIPSQGIFYSFFLAHYTPKFNVVLFADLDSLIAALSNGRINAAFVDNNEANYWELNGGGQFTALGKPIKVADGIGIIALPKNAPLIQQFNQQIKVIEEDQEYLNLYNTYFGI